MHWDHPSRLLARVLLLSTIPCVEKRISIAMETSSSAGGVALGIGAELVRSLPLGPARTHAAELLVQLDTLLVTEHLRPTDVAEVYVSIGPGSFTGLRVGVTVARTLGQMIPLLRVVAVPTPLAIAENVAQMGWERLGVLLGAKESIVHATLLRRDPPLRSVVGPPEADGKAVVMSRSRLVSIEELLAEAPVDSGSGWGVRPLVLTGEALGFFRDADWPEDVELADEDLWAPTAEGVWRVGRRLAEEGKHITAWRNLLPVYARRPEAVRLWDSRHGA